MRNRSLIAALMPLLGFVAGAIGPVSISVGDTVISMPAPRAKPPARVIIGTAGEAASDGGNYVEATDSAAANGSVTPTAIAITSASSFGFSGSGSATAEAAALNLTEGDIALYRYSGARQGTSQTYFSDGSYLSNGIRVYTYPRYYPQFVWGPFWGWGWGGFGFPFCR